MSVLQPSVRFTLYLEKVPSSLGTTTYRWSTRPLADAGAWTEGRIISWGSIERSMSTIDGDYDIASVDIEATDADGLIRGLLADPTTRTFTSREAAIELLSEAGRAAGTTWRTLFRGRITDIQPKIGRRFTARIADAVGSHFSGFDLEATLGLPITKTEHPNCSDKFVNRIYPIVLGEHSDVGAVDENGNAADKGLLPVIDVGDYLLASDGTIINTTDVPRAYLAAPDGLAAVVHGTAGTTSYEYAVTTLSNYGETTASTLTVTNGPATLNGTDYISLSWTAVANAVEHRVYRNNKLIARLNNGETFTSPETSYNDQGGSAVSDVGPPQTNTAQTDVTVAGKSYFGWGRLILKHGAAAEVHHLYASDLGSSPKRVRVDESRYGSEFLVYGRPGWPHADPYIEINGIRMGVAYARGEALKQHRDGAVTITWNGCGDDQVGDGSGNTITEYFPGIQHLINEYRLKDNGVGYKTGSFGPLETYSNGVAKLKTSAFAACQALTVTWIGGRGYQIALAITEPTTLREVIKRAAVSAACHFDKNHHGQFFPILVDDTVDPTTGRLYHERLNIIKAESQNIDHDAVETKVVYDYDYDTEAQKFRVTAQVLEDTAASAAYKAPRQRGTRQCYYTRDKNTALDANSRHLARYKVAPRYFTWRTDLTGLEDENGSVVRVTHYEGAGGTTGDDATPFLIVKHKTQVTASGESDHIILTGLDLGRMIGAVLPTLQNESTMSGNLGSETSSANPPTGAYELR